MLWHSVDVVRIREGESDACTRLTLRQRSARSVSMESSANGAGGREEQIQIEG